MASTGNHKIVENFEQNLTLHEMFRVVGDQLMPRDVRVLKFLNTMFLSEDSRSKIHDGFTFLLALEKIGRVDSSNFKYIIYVLRIITRQDLIPFVTLRRRKTGNMAREVELNHSYWSPRPPPHCSSTLPWF